MTYSHCRSRNFCLDFFLYRIFQNVFLIPKLLKNRVKKNIFFQPQKIFRFKKKLGPEIGLAPNQLCEIFRATVPASSRLNDDLFKIKPSSKFLCMTSNMDKPKSYGSKRSLKTVKIFNRIWLAAIPQKKKLNLYVEN